MALKISIPEVEQEIEKDEKEVKKDTKKDKAPLTSNLKTILAAIHKDKGPKSVIKARDIAPVERQLTGVFEFDYYTGGFPRGRYSIIWGPESSSKTTLALLAVAQAQKLPPPCNKAVFVNLEQVLDPIWAQKQGVDINELLVVNPAYGEEAVDITDSLIRADDVAIIVVDSIAALISSKEIAKSVEDYDVGTSSLLNKRFVNKMQVALGEEAKKDHYPCIILINQRRFKIGVMFGDPECLHGDTLINFVDGRSICIREVVEKKLTGNVWAYDEQIGNFVEAPILKHYYNGIAKYGELIMVTSDALDTKNGILSATVSKTHKFLTDKGWCRADELTIGHKLLTKYKSIINGTLKQFLVGVGCGDSRLQTLTGRTHRVVLRLEDSINPEYTVWKINLFNPFIKFTKEPNDSGHYFYRSSSRTDLFFLKEELQRCRHPKVLFDNFSWLSFAIWMMDDGNLSKNRYTLSIGRFNNFPEERKYISEELDKLGLFHKWHQNKAVVFDTKITKKIAENIAEFVPKCMQYKLPDKFKGNGGNFNLSCEEINIPYYVNILKVEPAFPRKYRDRRYFDIHVGGPNNYLVGNLDNGFVVHNTQPGGEALRFGSSLTLRTYGKNVIDKASNMSVFKNLNITVKKAKVPVRAASFSFDLCVHPHNGLNVGETDSFGMVKNHLQALGLIEKKPKGWVVEGETEIQLTAGIPTKVQKVWTLLSDIQDQYRTDKVFALRLQSLVLDSMTEYMLVEEKIEGPAQSVPGNGVILE